MPLVTTDGRPTQLDPADLRLLSSRLDAMKILFTETPFNDTHRHIFIDTLVSYKKIYKFTVEDLYKAIALTMQRWEQSGRLPTPRFVMDTIDPNAS